MGLGPGKRHLANRERDSLLACRVAHREIQCDGNRSCNCFRNSRIYLHDTCCSRRETSEKNFGILAPDRHSHWSNWGSIGCSRRTPGSAWRARGSLPGSIENHNAAGRGRIAG